MKGLAQVEEELIGAVYENRLVAACEEILALDVGSVEESGRALAGAARDGCDAIAGYCADERSRMVDCFVRNDIDAEGAASPHQDQPYHLFEIRILASSVEQAIGVAEAEGFVLASPLDPGAVEFLARVESSVRLIRVDDVTTQMVLTWSGQKPDSRVARIFRPTIYDYLWLPLPKPLWFLLFVVRPLRLAISTLRGSRRSQLGGFLGTPATLIPELLSFADVGEADVVMDLGCGDGRVVLEAAHLYGCGAIGIENRADLVALGRAEAVDRGLDGLVDFHVGDALDASVDQADVLFLFLPVATVDTLIPSLRKRLRPGTRIVVHEQNPLDEHLAPDRSRLLVADSALTVGHLWVV